MRGRGRLAQLRLEALEMLKRRVIDFAHDLAFHGALSAGSVERLRRLGSSETPPKPPSPGNPGKTEADGVSPSKDRAVALQPGGGVGGGGALPQADVEREPRGLGESEAVFCSVVEGWAGLVEERGKLGGHPLDGLRCRRETSEHTTPHTHILKNKIYPKERESGRIYVFVYTARATE